MSYRHVYDLRRENEDKIIQDIIDIGQYGIKYASKEDRKLSLLLMYYKFEELNKNNYTCLDKKKINKEVKGLNLMIQIGLKCINEEDNLLYTNSIKIIINSGLLLLKKINKFNQDYNFSNEILKN